MPRIHGPRSTHHGATELDKAAAELEKQARALRRNAAQTRRRSHGEQRLLARLETIRAAYLDGGMAGAVRATNRSPEDLAPIIHQIRMDDRQAARQKRNREIMALARRGWSNRQLSAKFKLAPSTLSSIIQKGLRQWPANLPGVDL